jgi:hypothetical protein
MTPQPAAALAGRVRPVPREARHRHLSSCFWDVDECRWQCVTGPGVHYWLEDRAPTGCQVADRGPGTRP